MLRRRVKIPRLDREARPRDSPEGGVVLSVLWWGVRRTLLGKDEPCKITVVMLRMWSEAVRRSSRGCDRDGYLLVFVWCDTDTICSETDREATWRLSSLSRMSLDRVACANSTIPWASN